MFSGVSSFVPGPGAPGSRLLYTQVLEYLVSCSVDHSWLPPSHLFFFLSLPPCSVQPPWCQPGQQLLSFVFSLTAERLDRIQLWFSAYFSLLVSSSTLVSTSCSVLVFLLIFPLLDGWLADLGMEEVTLVRVSCRQILHRGSLLLAG